MTLVELMVAISMFMMVLAAAVPVLVSSVKTEPSLRDRAGKIQQARALVERLGLDLRSGYAIDTATSSQLVFRSYVHQTACNGAPSTTGTILCRITYQCASGTCTRRLENPGGGSPGPLRTLVTGLSGSAIFSYLPASPAPSEYVQISIVFPAKVGDDAITLTDGFSLRNWGLTS